MLKEMEIRRHESKRGLSMFSFEGGRNIKVGLKSRTGRVGWMAGKRKEAKHSQVKTSGGPLWMSTERLEALADGIFAFAMTLLVLNLLLPDPSNLPPETQLHEMLLGQGKAFFNYVLSFLLLAIFWMVHTQQFHMIKGTNHVHLWINVIILMFIVLIPFSASIMSDYPDDPIANFFFAANMFIVGVLYYLNWSYATEGHRLIEKETDAQKILASKRRSLLVPLVSLIAMGLAFAAPGFVGISYILIPILGALGPFRG